jgi:hypothetical protein
MPQQFYKRVTGLAFFTLKTEKQGLHRQNKGLPTTEEEEALALIKNPLRHLKSRAHKVKSKR